MAAAQRKWLPNNCISTLLFVLTPCRYFAFLKFCATFSNMMILVVNRRFHTILLEVILLFLGSGTNSKRGTQCYIMHNYAFLYNNNYSQIDYFRKERKTFFIFVKSCTSHSSPARASSELFPINSTPLLSFRCSK